jgi:hypothetical protein
MSVPNGFLPTERTASSRDPADATNPFARSSVDDDMTPSRTFCVRARHLDSHHAFSLQERSFEAAAVAYVEALHDLPGDGEAISVIVREVDTGLEHCFRIDMDSGDTSACA